VSRAKIFILAWAVFLVLLATSFYTYIVVFDRPKLGKLNLFAPDSTDISTSNLLSNSWFGKLSSDRDLYPAKEADLHIDLCESEKNYVITIGNLTQTSLQILERNMKSIGIISYKINKDEKGFYSVDISSSDRSKMQAKLEAIKAFNLAGKN